MGGSSAAPVAAPGASVCSETSARWPGRGGVSSSTLWPRRRARAALARADDDDVAILVEAQQLGQRQVEPGGDLLRDRQRRAGVAALDLGEHRRADAAALGQVAKREVHRLAQALDARADGPVPETAVPWSLLDLGRARHRVAYAITYIRTFAFRSSYYRLRSEVGSHGRSATWRSAWRLVPDTRIRTACSPRGLASRAGMLERAAPQDRHLGLARVRRRCLHDRRRRRDQDTASTPRPASASPDVRIRRLPMRLRSTPRRWC